MKIGGLEKISLVDYPGYLAAVVFTAGCVFRCRFCYNPMLVVPSESDGRTLNMALEKNPNAEKSYSLNEDDFFLFLDGRKGKIEAVVVSGGEPTMQPDLPEFLKKIRQMGFLVKLDTNGSNPAMLKRVLAEKNINYLAMDIKADEESYDLAAGVKVNLEDIKKSVKLIMGSGLPYEFRTTCVPGLIDKYAIENMGKIIAGASAWYLQRFKSDTELVDKKFEKQPAFSEEEMAEFKKIGERYVKKCEIRG